MSAGNVLMYVCDLAVLSGERVSQMTRTYNDIAAVTLLLEEVWSICTLCVTPFTYI